MAKAGTVKSNVQFIHTPGGDDLAVLPRVEYDRLVGLAAIREWRDMIQGELAAAVGISQNYLSEIETGRRKGPAELQRKFARALGVPIDLLIE